MNKDNIVKRIKVFADSQNITLTEIERIISVSKGTLTKSFNQNTTTSSKNIEVLAEKFPLLSAEFLLRGKGEMLKSDPGSQLPAPGSQPDERLSEPSTGYYPTSASQENQLLRQHIIALERTIRDKEEIIRLLKSK